MNNTVTPNPIPVTNRPAWAGVVSLSLEVLALVTAELMLGLMAVAVAPNLLVAMAPSLPVLLGARLLLGVAPGCGGLARAR